MKKILLLLASVTTLAVTASATQVLAGTEQSLQSILDTKVGGTYSAGSINVNTNQVVNDAYWTADLNPAAYMVIEIAGYAGNNAFGIFQQGNAANKLQVFAGSVTGGSAPVSIVIPTTWTAFGFYMQNTVNGNFTWYSDSTLNAGGGLDHFVAYQGAAGATLSGRTFDSNDYVFGIEDLNLGDQDYNDMVVLVQNVNRVPDGGATVGLLGLSLCGVLFLRRKLAAGR